MDSLLFSYSRYNWDFTGTYTDNALSQNPSSSMNYKQSISKPLLRKEIPNFFPTSSNKRLPPPSQQSTPLHNAPLPNFHIPHCLCKMMLLQYRSLIIPSMKSPWNTFIKILPPTARLVAEENGHVYIFGHLFLIFEV